MADVQDVADLRDRTHVFSDRAHAGRVLGRLLEGRLEADAKVVAVPAGGIPVAHELAGRLGWRFKPSVAAGRFCSGDVV
jgi:adenine/guanine phosphoribosyltransferase-like PRPP-binding protein